MLISYFKIERGEKEYVTCKALPVDAEDRKEQPWRNRTLRSGMGNLCKDNHLLTLSAAITTELFPAKCEFFMYYTCDCILTWERKWILWEAAPIVGLLLEQIEGAITIFTIILLITLNTQSTNLK